MSEAIQKRPIDLGERGLSLRSFDDMYRFSDAVVKSGIAQDGDTVARTMIKLQAGLELGFSPMQALQMMIVTDKGKLSMMAVAMLALIRRSPLCKFAKVDLAGKGDDRYAYFRFVRAGDPVEQEVRYSVDDAKTARLWAKQTKSGYPTPWVTSPDDMLIARVISRCAKRCWSDVILGIEVNEVAEEFDDLNPRRTAPLRGARVVDQPAVLQAQLQSGEVDPLFDAPEFQEGEPIKVVDTLPPGHETKIFPADDGAVEEDK